MANTKQPEVWLRGQLEGIPPHLQPVAHALLQAREEINEYMQGFPEYLLWEKPAGVASPGFHLQHLTGVLDRLFTYAQGKLLTDNQLQYLKAEGTGNQSDTTVAYLLQQFNQQVDVALAQLSQTNENELLEFRGVGRAQLPSTVFGLLFHSAEHTMRHTGQLLVTVRVLKQTVEEK
ncbi:DinB family protein [Flavisolibacter tropicus]|uniref:Metal-dependent hydrolase n=1 Tax=Flavisolibacter tropicus TaxID=1492898 RepID=A0A172U2L7_9BACT|nr:DinB family protein [Flavisolibacter tropicus]ANE53227.1 metal-dependent hydrolase [Flavisolibacter tropicus]